MIDLTNTLCAKCRKGRYQETSIHDDIDGVLRCNKCGHKVKRWKKERKLKPVKGLGWIGYKDYL